MNVEYKFDYVSKTISRTKKLINFDFNLFQNIAHLLRQYFLSYLVCKNISKFVNKINRNSIISRGVGSAYPHLGWGQYYIIYSLHQGFPNFFSDGTFSHYF